MFSDAEPGTPPDAAVDLLWRPREPGRRGPKPTLTVPEVVRTAVAVADAEGLEAATLQRLAVELDVTKMALYRYVASKSDLVSLMVELAVESPPVLDDSLDWRARAEHFADLVDEVWSRHPWLPWATVGERVMGPREMGWVQAGLTVFDGTTLEAQERLDAVGLLFGHLRAGHSVARSGTLPWRRDGPSRPDVRAALETRPAEFAVLLEAMEAAADRTDEPRTFGIRVILDGLESLMDRRGRR